jgi:hypothetical protein
VDIELVVDVVELENQIVGHARLGQQNIHLSRHAAGDGMDREFDVDARGLQQLDELIEFLLPWATARP